MIDFVQLFLHIDDYLVSVTSAYGALTYLLLFIIIFLETGLVVTPFLPGDSLLFAAGAVASLGSLNLAFLIALLFVAAVIGDTANYWIGRTWGIGIAKWAQRRNFLIRAEHIKRTQEFYDMYGPHAIVLARFVPIIRTFAPFVAGIGMMDYRKFISYNVIGGAAWVCLFILLGFFFGGIPLVKDNFSIVIIAIVLISIIPIIVGYARRKKD